MLEEKSHDVYSSCGIKLPEDIVVSFENFSAFPPASGDKISYAASLQTLNFTINRGHLIVIVGPPGSGKVTPTYNLYSSEFIFAIFVTFEKWIISLHFYEFHNRETPKKLKDCLFT